MKCIHCNGDLNYDPHKKKVYSVVVKGVVVGITCRFCGWTHYKKIKSKAPVKVVEELDESEYS